jgi:uncharacterized protein YjeT (DUF2065 family)
MACHLLVAAPFYQRHQQQWTPLFDRLAVGPDRMLSRAGMGLGVLGFALLRLDRM